MKRFDFLLNSIARKIILFLVTFAIGVAASALLLFQNSPPTVPLHQTPPTFEKPKIQAVQVEVKEPESSIAPNIVQSLVVDFPVNGRVIVQAIEEVGKFPQMVFISEKTGKVLHRSSIEDEDKWLIPEKDNIGSQPDLRFRVVRSSDFKSLMIMSVGLYHGGSDNAFYLTVFGEIDGKIRRLNEKPMFANIQGGYYLGHLNKKIGYGLAVWNFIWGDGVHYDKHNYEIEIFQLQNGKLKRMLRKISRKTYDSDESFNSLRELGIKVSDQRTGIPRIKDCLE